MAGKSIAQGRTGAVKHPRGTLSLRSGAHGSARTAIAVGYLRYRWQCDWEFAMDTYFSFLLCWKNQVKILFPDMGLANK